MQKQGPENIFTRIPLVNQLVSLGWDAKQLRTSPEWRIPKRPSEAAKREAGNKFEAYPVDLVIFDDINNIDDWEHVKIIFETKKPDVEAGLSQLEI